MKKYIVSLKVADLPPHDVNAGDDGTELAMYLAKTMKEGAVELHDYEETDGMEMDNHCDDQEPIIANETVYYVELDIHEPSETDDDEFLVDFHDSGESLYYYVVDALELRAPVINFVWECSAGKLTRRNIGIELQFIIDTTSMDDHDEIMEKLSNGNNGRTSE